ncbi:hypothetical protein HPB51_028044 [Rhipicephalus microplus]|uniref:Uncharacterized protein n=1 Tax=Rhipicephalus microplus TaxID=6941 RepID=A0A9J6CYE2_RHIMP|nr:hypothetical protein HPB51_028044 [Rhipicephalus microplus]
MQWTVRPARQDKWSAGVGSVAHVGGECEPGEGPGRFPIVGQVLPLWLGQRRMGMSLGEAVYRMGFVMSMVVVLSTKCEKNPDNIAPAIAAPFGDLTTLFLLSGYSSLMLYHPSLGGNLAAVFSCSLSSYLNRVTPLGDIPFGEHVCVGPLQMYYQGGEMANVAYVLVGVVVPGQTLFAVLSRILRFGKVSMTITFCAAYCGASLGQVCPTDDVA